MRMDIREAALLLEQDMRRYILDRNSDRRAACLDRFRERIGMKSWAEEQGIAPIPAPGAFKHFAIGQGHHVSVWATETKVDEDGRHFECNNGGWAGRIKDGLIYLHGSPRGYPATIIWEGNIPPRIGDYNVVIQWIEAQVLGSMSKLYGEPHPEASTWFWRETKGGKAGAIRGSTEMEALDRLREAFPDAGAIEWQRRVSATWAEPEPRDEDEVAF